MRRILLVLAISVALVANAFSQTKKSPTEGSVSNYKYSVSTTVLSFFNFGDEKTNTHHYEVHVGYRLTPKDKISIKIATWKLFAPMGMPIREQLKFAEGNFYAGRLRETGIGVTYQRMIWKGVFARVEILPQLDTYLDENDKKIGNGFKLYTSYHLGYDISFFKNRFHIEPQIQFQYWPINTNVPQTFKDEEDKWNNNFQYEPNIHISVNF